MRRSRMWVGAILLGTLLGVAVACVGWRVRPLPTVREVMVYDTHQVVETRSRTHRLLPLAQWGVESGNSIGCGGQQTIVTTSREFAFFSVEDTWEQRVEAAPGATELER